MRTYFKSVAVPKRFAKAIVQLFPALKLSTAQEWAAQILGYRNWHELDLFTKNYSGKPTPDIWFDSLLDSTFEEQGNAKFEHQRARLAYQREALENLLNPMVGYSAVGAALMDLLYFAKNGDGAKPYGNGSPLFNAIQAPWFTLEQRGQYALYEQEMEVYAGDYIMRSGFTSVNQLLRWASGLTGQSIESLREEREDFYWFGVNHPLQAGGSNVRLTQDELGNEVVVQSARYRFWVQRPNKRMLGGFTLTIHISSRRDTTDQDEIEFTIHDAWSDPKSPFTISEYGAFGVVEHDAILGLSRFLLTRIGMDAAQGLVKVTHDEQEESKSLAMDVRDLLFDMARDDGFSDVDPYLQQEVALHESRYRKQPEFAGMYLPSALV